MEESIALVRIENLASRMVHTLSDGERQKVMIAKALAQETPVIFLDEPISHLDDCNGKIMSNLLLEEAGRQEAGIIVTSIGKHIELPYNHVLRL